MDKITVHFVQPDGQSEAVEVDIHHTLMEAARFYSKNYYIPGIEAECGGGCACATCHVIIDKKWVDKVGKPKETSPEQELLDYEPKATENSRLACQIDLTKDLDGLIVQVP